MSDIVGCVLAVFGFALLLLVRNGASHAGLQQIARRQRKPPKIATGAAPHEREARP
jgi:uncharacterized membrane protein